MRSLRDRVVLFSDLIFYRCAIPPRSGCNSVGESWTTTEIVYYFSIGHFKFLLLKPRLCVNLRVLRHTLRSKICVKSAQQNQRKTCAKTQSALHPAPPIQSVSSGANPRNQRTGLTTGRIYAPLYNSSFIAHRSSFLPHSQTPALLPAEYPDKRHDRD